MGDSKYLSDDQLKVVGDKLNDWRATSGYPPIPEEEVAGLVSAVVHLSENAIATQAIAENGEPFIGLATTMQLIDEVSERVTVAHANGDKWPKSNELSGPGSGVTTMKLTDELKYRVHVADNNDMEWPHRRTVDGGFSIKVDA